MTERLWGFGTNEAIVVDTLLLPEEDSLCTPEVPYCFGVSAFEPYYVEKVFEWVPIYSIKDVYIEPKFHKFIFYFWFIFYFR